MPVLIDPAMLEEALAGGVLIGAAAAGLILVNGRIAGISGILAGALGAGGLGWQRAFIAGLVVAGLGAGLFGHDVPAALAQKGWGLLAVAGVLVGIGTRLGSGCTSGHGVCGIARLSPRSLAATGVFMVTAGITVFVARHVVGGG